MYVSDCQVLEHAGIPGKHNHLCSGGSGDFSTGIFGSRDTRLDVYGRPLLWHCRHKVTDTLIIRHRTAVITHYQKLSVQKCLGAQKLIQ